MVLKIKKLCEDAILPSRAHQGDAGLDLYAAKDVVIEQGKTALVPVGIAIQLQQGFEAQVRPRSGLALQHSITVLNTPGTIDSNYRGEIGVILINHGSCLYKVEKGKRIAQLVIARYEQPQIVEVDELGDSERGEGGFGSSGEF